jgi:hypothetical protein
VMFIEPGQASRTDMPRKPAAFHLSTAACWECRKV